MCISQFNTKHQLEEAVWNRSLKKSVEKLVKKNKSLILDFEKKKIWRLDKCIFDVSTVFGKKKVFILLSMPDSERNNQD